MTDGRPTLTFPAKDSVGLVLDISNGALIISALIWTPWFFVFGSISRLAPWKKDGVSE